MTRPDQLPSPYAIFRVDITCVHHYSRNPRRQQNPEYERIKASIRAEGLDQPLVVSQEPGATDYVIHSGGNTRLRILTELLEETGDERFRTVDCIFKPWTQESNVLFAHLRENDLRGGLPFIDKALAVFEAKSLLEKELEVEDLSQRQMEEVFKKRGFALSHSMISKMGYAVEVLWPVMPKALAAGLGRPQVEKIRALERATRDIWHRRQLGDDTVFDAVFAELCRRHDSPEWDIQPLRDALENEIAIESEQNRQVVHLEMEAQMAGRAFDYQSHCHEQAEDKSHGAQANVRPTDDGLSTEQTVSNDLPTDDDILLTNRLDRESGTNAPQCPQNHSTLAVGLKTPINRTDLGALRIQLWDCAATLAEHYGLGKTVTCLPDLGLGFLLVDLPPEELTDTLDPDILSVVSALWWQLAASSELTIAPVDIVLAYIAEGSALHQALANHDAGLLFSCVWTPDPAHLSSQLWRQLNPLDWQLLLQIMESYRAIKRLANDTGIELWATGEDDGDVVQ